MTQQLFFVIIRYPSEQFWVPN